MSEQPTLEAHDLAMVEAAHCCLCVFAAETRLREAADLGAAPLRRRLPSRSAVSDDWMLFAKRCVDADVNPVSFIRRLFATSPLDYPPPRIIDVVCDQPPAERFRDLGSQLVEALKVSLLSQVTIMDRYVSFYGRPGEGTSAAVKRLTLDAFVPLHPVIRLTLLTKAGVITRWLPNEPAVLEAVSAYGRIPDLYDTVWGSKWITPDLRQHGVRLYNRKLKLEFLA